MFVCFVCVCLAAFLAYNRIDGWHMFIYGGIALGICDLLFKALRADDEGSGKDDDEDDDDEDDDTKADEDAAARSTSTLSI